MKTWDEDAGTAVELGPGRSSTGAAEGQRASGASSWPFWFSSARVSGSLDNVASDAELPCASDGLAIGASNGSSPSSLSSICGNTFKSVKLV